MGVNPSSLSPGDRVVILFDEVMARTPPYWGGRRMYGSVERSTSQGAIINPTNEEWIRLVWKKVYAADGESVVEEVNGEHLF